MILTVENRNTPHITRRRFSVTSGSFAWLCLGAALFGVSTSPAWAEKKLNIRVPWDWSEIIGTGQSLSVGAHGQPVVSSTQRYNNLKLSTGTIPWPIDPNDPSLIMAPLTEPVGRRSPTYPSSWPTNIDGETYHTSMSDELTALMRASSGRDFVSVQSEVGEDGQGMVFLQKNAIPKGVNGHSYQAAMTEVAAISRLAKAAGKTYGIGAVVVTHGETDCGNPNYEAELHQLWQDYNTDLANITGQERDIQMIVSQQNSVDDHSPSTLAQWKVGVDYPKVMVCSGPKYQYPYFQDGVHLTAEGYRELGEKYAEVYYERVILGRSWAPLQPMAVSRNGAIVSVRFHVPAGPLVWDTSFTPPHSSIPEWKYGKGFEVSTASGTPVQIDSATIAGDTVIITCGSDPGLGSSLGYAMVGEKDPMPAPYSGTRHWGLLRDSDPFQGSVTGKPQPNYAVAFQMQLP